MNTNDLATPEKDAIKQEITEHIDELIRGCESLDMEAAFKVFSDSPDFLMMGTDGTLVDHHTYVKNNIEYLLTCSKFRLTTKNAEIRIINPEAAVYAWTYSAEALLKTGERDIIDDAGASFVFHKITGNWKVVYYHESSSIPRRETP
jgi:hypothetical protein